MSSYIAKKRKRAAEPLPSPSREEGLSLLSALHDVLFQSLMDRSMDGNHKRIRAMQMTDELQHQHWKLTCCQNFRYVQPNGPEERFMRALQITSHNLRFSEAVNEETLLVVIPWLGDSWLYNQSKRVNLRVMHDFGPPWDGFISAVTDPTISIQVHKSYIGERVVLSETLFTARAEGEVMECNGELWDRISKDLGLVKNELQLSFVLRFLSELVSRNGRNPIHAVNRSYYPAPILIPIDKCDVNPYPFPYPFLEEGKHGYQCYRNELSNTVSQFSALPQPLIQLTVAYACASNVGTIDMSVDEKFVRRPQDEEWEWML